MRALGMPMWTACVGEWRMQCCTQNNLHFAKTDLVESSTDLGLLGLDGDILVGIVHSLLLFFH